MIHIIYGEDSLVRDERFKALTPPDLDNPMAEMNIVTFDGASVSMGELVQSCYTIPFLSDNRTIVVKGLLARFDARTGKAQSGTRRTKDEWDELADQLKDMPDSTTLIIRDSIVNGNNRILRALRPIAMVSQCRLPSVRDMHTWVRQRSQIIGASIEPQAIRELVDSIGNNTLLMANEMEKLATYRLEQPIRLEDVKSLVASSREANIFNAVDAVVEGNIGKGLSLTHDLMDEGNHPMLILTMIARQVRFLILAKDLLRASRTREEIGKRLGISGYPLEKTLNQEGRFTEQELKDIHTNIVVADLSIKTGALDEVTAIDTLVLRLAR